jgi:hypothetical protein
MSALSIQPTYPIFTETDGLPLENGYIWIGAANLDPQGNPISVYWDAALTIPAAQPIRTLNGYPSRSGTPARLYVNSDYSIRVQNSKGSLVYSALAATERYGNIINAQDVIYNPPFTGAEQTNVEAKLSQTVSVKDFGAIGDGVTDDTIKIQAAIDATPEGATLYFPVGIYLFSNITISESIEIFGEGWYVKTNQAFGNANWLTADALGGAVLKSTATSGTAITFSNASLVKHFRMQNIAVLGPGTGTSIGVSVANTVIATVQNRMVNVLVANFSVGVQFINSYESQFTSLLIRGCQRGFSAPNVSGGGIFSDNHFYRCAFETCSDGVNLQLASGISFHGCLWQNCTEGLRLQPQVAGGVETITVEGESWFENVGGNGINIDATNGSLKHLIFKQSRMGAGAIAFNGSDVFNYVTFKEFSAGGVALTIPATATNVYVEQSEFLSITDNSKRALVVAGNSSPRTLGWIRFNGTAGTISASNNLTLTKNGTGDYTLAFTNQPASTNYTATVSCQMFGIGPLVAELYSLSTTGMNCRVYTPAGVLTDTGQVYVIVVGNF